MSAGLNFCDLPPPGVRIYMIMGAELRQALRQLIREPGFAAAAILALGLGLAANTAIFSLVHGILLSPLPFRQPGRLVAIQERIPKLAARYPMIPVNARAWQTWQRDAHTLDGIALIGFNSSYNLTGAGEPVALQTDAVSANLFQVLGVHPLLGSDFSANADRPGSRHEAILTYALWRQRFHADPSLIGRGITLNGSLYIVRGVLSPDFHFFKGTELSPIISLGASSSLFVVHIFHKDDLQESGNFNYAAIARLRPGATAASANAELNRLCPSLTSSEIPELQAVVLPLRAMATAGARRGLWLMQAAVLAVLLIICVNLANLLLARAAAREQEASLRAALGASRGRLLRLVLMESLLLALAGGLLGLALAGLGMHALLAAAPASLPRRSAAGLDLPVLAFTFLIALLSGLLAGAAPAWRLAQSPPRNALYGSGPRAGASRRRVRAHAFLLGAEAALCVALLLVAGLLLAGFARLTAQPTGFAIRSVREVRINLTSAAYKKPDPRRQFWLQLLASVQRLPGVTSAALINTPPLGGNNEVNPIMVPGDTRPLIEQPIANYRWATPGAFRLLHIPLLSGRRFTAADRGQPVALVSAAAARAAWPGRNPIGQLFRRDPDSKQAFRVVGVVADMRGIGLFDSPGLMVYRPFDARYGATLLLRSRLPAASLAPELRRAVWSLDPELPVGRVRSMRQVMDRALAPNRFQLLLVSVFALAALLLVAFGIYAVVAYATQRRTREIGIRVALGAGPAAIYRLLVLQALRPVAAGALIGLAAAIVAGRWLSSLLFNVPAYDPTVLAAVIAVLLAAALLASSLPARGSLRLDPVAALRQE